MFLGEVAVGVFNRLGKDARNMLTEDGDCPSLPQED